MNDQLREYRAHLVEARQKAYDAYDRTLIYLAAGAIAVSMTFIDASGSPQPETSGWLIAAWVFWLVTLALVLLSLVFSQLALTKTVRQVDNDTIYDETPGGHWRLWTQMLNIGGCVTFLSGVVLIIVFAGANL